MPSKQRSLRKMNQVRHQRRTDSVSPGSSQIPDSPLLDCNGSADVNGEAFLGTTPKMKALQLSTPASSIGKKRGRPPKAGNKALAAGLDCVSLVDTPSSTVAESATISPCLKKNKVFEYDQKLVTEAITSTPVSTKGKGGHPFKKKGGPGRGKTVDAMSESSIMDESIVGNETMQVEDPLDEVDADLKLEKVACTSGNVPEHIDFNVVHINFAETRNFNCRIWRWAAIGLYQDDATSSGPRFIETCWNNPTEWLNDGFIAVYLAYLATISQRKVVVLDSIVFDAAVSRVRGSYRNYTFGFDSFTSAEVILMPINFPGHWTILVHDVEAGTFFADSLQMSTLDTQKSNLIKNIIAEIASTSFESIAIDYVDNQNLTPQHDGFSCGYFVCLYAESWLMSQGTFILPNLNINYEKKRILWHLNELYSSDDVPYHPRDGVSSPCPFINRLAMEDVQSSSKIIQSISQTDSDDSDDITIVDVLSTETKMEDDIISIVLPKTEQAVNSQPGFSVETQAEVPGETQPNELGVVTNSCISQEPIAQLDDDVVFVRPKTPPRRSLRNKKRLSDFTLANALGPATPITKRCKIAHKGWSCAAAKAKHFPEYCHSGTLGEKKCPNCGAHLFPHETSSLCCRDGRVVLPPLSPHPEALKELLMGANQSREGKEFVKHESRYNNLLQFASVSAGSKPCPAGGPMAVILNGDFHRQISSMQAGSLQTPGFSQLYILDPAEAMEHRRTNPTFTGEKITNENEFAQGHKLNKNTLTTLENMINEVHPAAVAYKKAREQLQDMFEQQKSKDELRFFRMTLLNQRTVPTALKDPKLHPHQIITPSTGEGMFAIHADPTGVPAPKGIWVENKEGKLKEIAPFSPWTDSLTYPLIKPRGDDGYSFENPIPFAKPPSRRQKINIEDQPEMASDDETSLKSFDAQSVTSEAESLASDTASISSHFGGSRKFITLRDHCKYYLAIRDDNVKLGYHHILSCGGGLGQRWILDQAAKIDWQTATWLRRPEMDLRISTPKNMLLYLIKLYNKQQAQKNPNAPPKSVDDIGSVVRFAEQNVNSMQFWKKMYEDCNTIMARCHNPKKARLFITFTNNREWPEFKANIFNNGQVFTDRFDMWMRVWTSKVQQFRNDLYKNNFFGRILGSGESMEFQGRGGPHAHIVAQSDLDAIPEVIQEYIWAHIPSLPDKDDDTPIANMHREIRELIHLQLHRCADSWCGPRDPNYGRCKKQFPAPFSNLTILRPDRPALYFRPSPADGGAQIQIGNIIYDNSHVVPFNPFILIKYRVHHNVLFAYGNKANIKYALKYPFKGPGHCYVECKEESGKINIDEPAQYAKMNFRGSTEAYALIMSQPFARLSHNVVKLNIHLPGQQPVVFRAFQQKSMAEKVEQGDLPESKCSAYWKQWRNVWKDDPEFKHMLFEQVPERFRWKKGTWVAYKRKQSARPPIGRIVPVPPTDLERFALYMLMKHFPGDPDDLKIVNGKKCDSFIEAATMHGLLEDDLIWEKTLTEASLHRWPDQMRWLFVSMLVFGHPSNALVLWNKFKEHMYNPQGIANAAQRLSREMQALADIDWRLYNFGYSCVHFGLPDPPNSIAKNTDKAIEEFFFGDEDLNVPPGQQNDNQPQQDVPPLNSDQQIVFDAVVKAIQSDPLDQTVTRRFFIYGDGGTGKTFLFGQIIRRLRKPPNCHKVLATASTGCAAILLPYGKTAHSTFRLGRDVSLDKLPSIPHESFFARRIREAQLIIIDEITMLHNMVIEVIDRVCKEMAIRQHKDLLFGGKTVIFSGDFKQSLPVVPRESIYAQVTACFQKSALFAEFTTMKLTINQRMGEGQQEYLQMCRQIGLGETGEHFWIPPQYLVQSSEELIDFVYPDFQKLLGNDKELLRRLILAPHIETCDEVNELMMENVPGQVREYLSTDKPLDERPLDIDEIESEVAALNRRNDSGMSPHRLRLKVGCVVVLLINKSDREGLINGTRIVIEELGDDKIVGRAINGTALGGQVRFFIERTRQVYEEKAPGGIKYERLQFPIKSAFAMTINKGQGQTIDIVGIDLEREVFSHGQLYTAFSRATDGNNVRVYAPNREVDAQGQARVHNIVAAKMLQLQ